MLNKLFIDTDIILDIVLNRDEFFEESSAIFKLFENDEVLLYTSSTIIINAQYVAQKFIQREKCRKAIYYLLDYFILLEANMETIKRAYESGFRDIEDAIQYYTATRDDTIDFFITRNVKDFRAGENNIRVLSPRQFVNQIK